MTKEEFLKVRREHGYVFYLDDEWVVYWYGLDGWYPTSHYIFHLPCVETASEHAIFLDAICRDAHAVPDHVFEAAKRMQVFSKLMTVA